MKDTEYHWWLVNFKEDESLTKGGLSCAYCATTSKNLTKKDIEGMESKHKGRVICLSYLGENTEADFDCLIGDNTTYFYGG